MKKLITLSVAMLALVGNPAFAASATWQATTSNGNWVTAAGDNNWGTAGAFPGSTTLLNSADTGTFTSSSTTSININSSTLNIKGITFGTTPGNPALSAFTIGSTTGNSIFLTSGGAISYVADTTPTNTVETINAPLVFEGNYTFSNANATASNTLNFNGAISNGTASAVTLSLSGSNTGANIISGVISNGTAGGTTSLSVGGGTWVVNNANTFTGGVAFGRGTLDVNNANALGSGTLTFANASTFDNTSGAPITLATNNAITLNGSVNFVGTNSMNLGTGTVTLNTTPSVTVSANSLTIGGVITGAFGLSKGGAGTLILTGANVYTGATTINAGIVNYQNATAFGTNSVISVATAGTAQVQGGIAGGSQNLTLNGNGATGATGALESVSGNNSYAGNIALGADSSVAADTGTLTLSGVISGAHAFTKTGSGTVVLTGTNTYSGSNGSNGTTVSAGTLVAGGSVASTATAGALGTGALFLGDANTTVNNSSAALDIGGAFTIARSILITNNATTGVYSIGGSTDNSSIFSGVITADQSFSVTQVATTGTNALNITGGLKSGNAGAKVITFANAGAVNVSGTAISDGSGTVAVTQSGTGTTTLAAGNTYTGATTINAGTLRVTGSIAAGSAVGINSGGTLSGTGTIFGTVTDNSGGNINLQDGSIGTLTVGGLATNGGSGTLTFEIGNNTASSIDRIADSGSLSIASGTTITIANILGSTGQTLALGDYTLLTYGTATGLNNLSLASSTLDGFNLSLLTSTNGQVILVVSAGGGVTDTGTDYYNGTGSDLTQASAYDTGLATATATPTAPSATSNLFFSANRNTATSGTVGSNLEVNSINFGTGGTKSTFAISGSGTITIDATAANGNTAGSGITIASGGGSASISNAIALGANQSFTPTDASSVLTLSGTVSGSHQLTKSGAGTVILSSTTGNSYSGGTAVTSGRLLAANTSGSATGSGAVSVTGNTAILGGSGAIAGPITLSSGGMLYSGATASAVTSGAPGTGAVNGTAGGLKLSNALNVNGGTLSFALANQATPSSSGALTTSYISTTGQVNFTGTDTIDLVDTTNGNLSLRLNQSYVLISAASDSAFSGLVTVGANGVLTLDGNGTVLGVWAGGSNALTDYTAITINQYAADGVTLLNGTSTSSEGYYEPSLILENGDLEVVPEPGTWALMIGGLALLVVIQRRKNKLG